MNIQNEINHVINEYEKFEKLFEEHDYNLDDYDEHYKIWLKATSKEVAKKITEKIEKKIKKDMIDLCEDNETMVNAIREYFGEEVENENVEE